VKDEGDQLLQPKSQLNERRVGDHHLWRPREVQVAAQLLFRHLAKSMRTVVRDGGDLLPRPKVVAQRTSTGLESP
jgi:hypothetical protein